MLGLGTPELIFIGFICVLLFGTNKLPELGRSVATTIKEFKKSMKEVASDEVPPAVDKTQK